MLIIKNEYLENGNGSGLYETYFNLEQFRESLYEADMEIVEEILLNRTTLGTDFNVFFMRHTFSEYESPNKLNGPKVIVCKKIKRGEK